ncbi:MAG: tripartite tricarboxylate transporter substrate binding protein [Proteobacteria bacterium]|nr:tripartite tricarboxylate transporter substrate binding protein [Pseudomonadota bacterium]
MFRHFLLLLIAGCVIVAPARADGYPERPIRMLIPFAVGGSTDVAGRIVAAGLTESLGRQIIVDNRTGAAGIIATEISARANPDGYTLYFGSASTLAVNPAVYKRLPYDVLKDFELISLVAKGVHVLVINSSINATSVRDLIALAKKQPGKMTFASSGTGGVVHLAGEQFRLLAGIELNHVPFKGGGPAAVALLGGEVDMMVNDLAPVLVHMKSGRLRALAVAGAQRSALLPELQTFAEAGLPGVESASWCGLVAPLKTPQPVIARLSADLAKIVASPEYRDRLANVGMEPMSSTSQQFAAYMRSEMARWSKVAKAANVQLDQ